MLLIDGADDILTLQGAHRKSGRHLEWKDLSIEKKSCVVVNPKSGLIEYIGARNKIPQAIRVKIKKEISVKGKNILPGFVECHTHSVFAGNRANEFEMRNQGVSYQEIAAKGGGILSTMRATRAASEKTLLQGTQKHVNDFLRQGVTTIEIKSGYGLSVKDEIKCLSLLKKIQGAQIVPTFLGAHAIPPEFVGQAGEYLKLLAAEALPVIARKRLAKRVDIFIEKGFFSVEDARWYLTRAQSLGFDICIHADQITLSGGTELALELGALSAEHMIQISDSVVQKVAQKNFTAVLLPSADLYMKCAYPPARKLLDQGARVALSTDFNPGTAPSKNISLVGLLARLEMKMKLEEVIAGYTINAAYALNLQNQVGSLEVGKRADFVVLDSHYDQLFYDASQICVANVFVAGKSIQV